MKEKKIRVVKIIVTHPYLDLPHIYRFSETEFNLEDLEKIEAVALDKEVEDTGYKREDYKLKVFRELEN